jgi:hypothetical protein
MEAMKEVEFVKASRVVGQGSEFLRQQSTEFLFGTVLPMLPESGRAHLIQDVIASRAGQHAVDRYYPVNEASRLPDDQYAIAMGQVADMKIGVPAVVTETQNPALFAQTFLQAADQAAGTLEQGGNPAEVAAFLNLAGQAIAQHLQRMAADPSRKALVKQLTEQWKQLAKVHDQLVQHIQQQQAQQQEEQQRMQEEQAANQSDFAIAQQRMQGDLALKAQKTQAGIADKNIKTRQALSIKDATTAHKMRLETAQHLHDSRMAEMQGDHDRMMAEKNGKEKTK